VLEASPAEEERRRPNVRPSVLVPSPFLTIAGGGEADERVREATRLRGFPDQLFRDGADYGCCWRRNLPEMVRPRSGQPHSRNCIGVDA